MLAVVIAVLAQASDSLESVKVDEMKWVYFAYGLSIVVLGGYAMWTIARGRRVGRQLPPDERRWM